MEGAAGDVPKPLACLPSGNPLIVETLTNARTSGLVECCTVVVGHMANVVERELAGRTPKGFVDTVFNPFYAAAGPLGSVWAIRSLLRDEDVLLGNGDTLFGNAVFESLRAPRPGLTLVYSKRPAKTDDVKVLLHSETVLARVGKDLGEATPDGASAGLLAICGAAARSAFVESLDRFMRDSRGSAPRAIWHDLVNHLADQGSGVRVLEVAAEGWQEVDTPADYAMLHQLGSTTG
jgi:choline kinase